jgi:hypothetical protein
MTIVWKNGKAPPGFDHLEKITPVPPRTFADLSSGTPVAEAPAALSHQDLVAQFNEERILIENGVVVDEPPSYDEVKSIRAKYVGLAGEEVDLLSAIPGYATENVVDSYLEDPDIGLFDRETAEGHIDRLVATYVTPDEPLDDPDLETPNAYDPEAEAARIAAKYGIG